MNIKFHYTRSNLKIFTEDIATFDALKDILIKGNFEFYTYTTKTSKPKHLVLKGLPNLSVEEVTSDIKKLGFQPIRCVVMKQKTPPPYEAPMFLITLSNEVDVNSVRCIKYICDM